MRIIVTGASGLVGGAIFTHLEEGNHQVFGTRFSQSHDNNKIFQLDLTKPSDTWELFHKLDPDLIIHCAATLPLSHESEESKKSAEFNEKIDKNILTFCKNEGVRLVYFSSAFAYDRVNTNGPLTEDSPLNPQGDYLAQKLKSEVEIRTSLNDHVIFRLSSPFGPGFTRRTVFTIFMELAERGENLKITGSDKRLQDFIYVKDINKAIDACLNNKLNGTYNLSSGSSSSLRELAEGIITACSSSSELIYEPAETGKLENNRFDNSKLLSDAGFSVFTLTEALNDQMQNV